MRHPLILFDFDGTLADTLPVGVALFNQIAKERNLPVISLENMETMRDKSAREVIKDLHIFPLRLPFLIMKLKKELAGKIGSIQPLPAIKDLIFQLEKEGYQQGIVTSNSRANVQRFLEANGINNVFKYVSAGGGLFGKARMIKKIIAANHYKPEEVLYIGDEVRDVEAARKAGVKIISVAWGANSIKALQAVEPDFLAEKPADILKFLRQL